MHFTAMKELIIEKVGPAVYSYFTQFVDVENESTLVISSTNVFNLFQHKGRVRAVVNLSKVNNIRFINKFFETVNSRIDTGDYYIGCVETFTARRARNPINKVPLMRQLYFISEFIFHRVFPKMWGLKKIYFAYTRGRNRLLSKAETLGRLVSCGFEIIEYREFGGLTYFVVKKSGMPVFDMTPSYGLIYKMPRIGKDGRIIQVYKFRTMHPYSEYLQDYVIRRNGYSTTGKPADDFRLTPWGRVLRRYWLDELPQVINILKGELKLVGIRPVGKRYFQDIPGDLQALRIKQKPGCIPPYVSLNMNSDLKSVHDAERKYLIDKQKSPYITDTMYFIRAVYTILVRKKRSA
jgi:lipopolysaccharide/colanic/teichoic acid biosynthesis glycosyltransferase